MGEANGRIPRGAWVIFWVFMGLVAGATVFLFTFILRIWWSGNWERHLECKSSENEYVVWQKSVFLSFKYEIRDRENRRLIESLEQVEMENYLKSLGIIECDCVNDQCGG